MSVLTQELPWSIIKGENNKRTALVVHVEEERGTCISSLGEEGVVFIAWLYEYEFHDTYIFKF